MEEQRSWQIGLISLAAIVLATPVWAQTPTLVQSWSSSSNPLGVGISGNGFKALLPNPVGAGNCLILAITYPQGSAPTSVSGSVNGSFGAAQVTASGGSGNFDSAIYIKANTIAGSEAVTVSFPQSVIPFQFDLSEWRNISATSPVGGSSSTGGAIGSSLATGFFTPANNDASGGNLIYNYYGLAAIASSNPATWTAGGSFTLVEADVAWTTGQGVPHAAQYFVQTQAAAINPSISANGDSTDVFNGLAIALKAADAGTAPASGIHVDRLSRQTDNLPPASLAIQFPCEGSNLLVFGTSASGGSTGNWFITDISDNINGPWTQRTGNGTGAPQIWDVENATCNSTLQITINSTAPNVPDTIGLWAISGAAPSPLDTTAEVPPTDVSGLSSIADQPDIMPSTAHGLVIALLQIGQGPGRAVASPPGARWVMTTYATETDLDLMENADGKADLYNTDTSPENWTWRITRNPNNSVSSAAIAYVAAPTAGGVSAPSRLGR